MKKLILSSAMLFFALSSLHAQTEFGIKSGYFLSIQNNTLSNEYGNFQHDGIYVGAFSEFSLSEHFSIRPEISYLRVLGYRAENDPLEKIDQLQVPVLASYQVSKNFKIFAGPSMMFLLTDNSQYDNFSFGINYGVSYDISPKLSLEASFTNGFQTVSESGPDDLNPFKTRINVLQIGLSYKF